MDDKLRADFVLLHDSVKHDHVLTGALLRIGKALVDLEKLLKLPDDDREGLSQRPGAAAPTQKKAAVSAEPGSGTRRHTVLLWIMNCRDTGSTDEEGQDRLNFSGNTYRPRRVELVDGGWVMDSGTTRPTRSGRDAEVWIATPKAYEAAKRNGRR